MFAVCDKVTAFVDGVHEKSTTMDYDVAQPIVSRQSSSLFLGHSKSVTQQLPHALRFQLGNIFLINGYALSLYFTS